MSQAEFNQHNITSFSENAMESNYKQFNLTFYRDDEKKAIEAFFLENFGIPSGHSCDVDVAVVIRQSTIEPRMWQFMTAWDSIFDCYKDDERLDIEEDYKGLIEYVRKNTHRFQEKIEKTPCAILNFSNFGLDFKANANELDIKIGDYLISLKSATPIEAKIIPTRTIF